MTTEILRFFHPLMRARALRRRPVCASLAGRRYALFRDAGGRPAALDGWCPHRRAPLAQGRVDADGRLVCPYHGWRFDALGHGASPSSPRLRHCDTGAYQVAERYGLLWMAARDTPLSALPALEQDGFEFGGSLSALVRAPLELALDNISEDEHFPFIHSTFGWDVRGLDRVRLETVTASDHSTVSYSGPQRASPWAMLGGVRAGDLFHNSWVTRFDPVHALYTFGWRASDGGAERTVVTRAAVFLVPETAMGTRIHMLLFLRLAPGWRLPRAALVWLARRIAATELRRDIALIEAVAAAPSTLSGMRLTRFDRALIHNRKLLQSLYWQGTPQQPVSELLPQRSLP